MNYYSEWNPFAAAWTRNLAGAGLVPPGKVDERDMREVRSGDLEGYTQCHWFAGLGGWPLALALAGFPADYPLWTASLPCQPWSVAGQRRGAEDDRHLWPAFAALVGECRPVLLVGEQVDSPDALEWLDGVRADLEAMQYAFGAAVLPAACVGAPHARHRIFWCAIHAVAESLGHGVRRGEPGETESAATGVQGENGQRGHIAAGVGNAQAAGCADSRDSDGPDQEEDGDGASESAGTDRLAAGVDDAAGERAWRAAKALQGGDGENDGIPVEPSGANSTPTPWDDFDLVWCLDGGIRRVPSAESGILPVAYGIPTRRADPRMGYLLSRLEQLGHGPKAARRILADARRNRVGRLQGVGNAIVPQVAAIWIRAVMEELGIQLEVQP